MSRRLRPPASALIRAVHAGHAPNCSATGSVVGVALLSAVATAAAANLIAAWLTARADGTAPPGTPPRLRRDPDGGVLRVPSDAPGGPARVELTHAGVALAERGGVQAPSHPAHDDTSHDPSAAPDVVPPHGHPGPRSDGDGRTAPDEAHLSVTARCPVGCEHCYLSATPTGQDADLAELSRAMADLAAAGAHEIALGGGEAALSTHTVRIAERARVLGLVPNLTTSGLGITAALAAELAPVLGQINLSLDGPLRTQSTERAAWRALDHLQAAGARIGINTVLTQRSWPVLDALGHTLAERGVTEWQWLRLKPSGRGIEAYAHLALRPAQRHQIWPRLIEIEARTGLTLRIDCAMVPFLAEHQIPVERLRAAGVYGCPGGERLLARTADGRWLPCSFAADLSDARPSTFTEAWRSDPTLQAWRRRAAGPPEPCASCAYQTVCRGGCRVVAAVLTGDPLAPDPECPRVAS